MLRVTYFQLIRMNKKGFSLVELLVAMLIIAIMMWPMLSNILGIGGLTTKTGDVMIATALTTQILELVRNKPFENLLPDADPLLKPQMSEKELRDLVKTTIRFEGDEFQYFNERFKRELTITPVKMMDTMRGKQPMMIQIVVRCTWISRDGKGDGELTLCSLVGNESAKILKPVR